MPVFFNAHYNTVRSYTRVTVIYWLLLHVFKFLKDIPQLQPLRNQPFMELLETPDVMRDFVKERKD